MAAVDRFKEWAASDKGIKYFRGKISDPLWIGRFGSEKLCRDWVTAQYVLMCEWLERKNPKYSAWASFAGRFLSNGLRRRADAASHALNPGLMTATQEEDYYNKPREGETGFTSIKDILSGKAQKENR